MNRKQSSGRRTQRSKAAAAAIVTASLMAAVPLTSAAQSANALLGFPISATDGTANALPATYNALTVNTNATVYGNNGYIAGQMTGTGSGTTNNGVIVNSDFEYVSGVNSSIGTTSVVGYYTANSSGGHTVPAASVEGVNANGQVIGHTTRYNPSPYTSSAGSDAWVASPGGSVTLLGLNLNYSGYSYVSSYSGYTSNSTPNAINDAGDVIGISSAYPGGSTLGQQATWLYLPANGSTPASITQTGLYSVPAAYNNPSLAASSTNQSDVTGDARIVSGNPFFLSSNTAISSSGDAVGFCTEQLLNTNGTSFTTGGNDGWLYIPGQGTTAVGLYQSGLSALNYNGVQYSYGGYVSGTNGLYRFTQMTGVSNTGQVAGVSTYYDPSGTRNGTVAFLYTPGSGNAGGTYSLLGFTGPIVAANNVSTGTNPVTGNPNPVVSLGYISTTGSRNSAVFALNDAGQSAGYSIVYSSNAYITSSGTGGPIADGYAAWFANKAGVVTRIGLTSQNGPAYVTQVPNAPGVVPSPGQQSLGGEVSQVTQLTQTGLVGGTSNRYYYQSGSSNSGTLGYVSFIYDSASGKTFTISDLPFSGVDPANNTTVTDYVNINYLSNNGLALGVAGPTTSTQTAFFWSAASGMIPLGGYAPSGSQFTKFLSINSDASVLYALIQGSGGVYNVAQISVASVWTATGSGDWNTGGNWADGYAPGQNPNNAVSNPLVSLGTSATVPSTVNLSSDVTVGSLTFNNSNAYTVSSTSGSTLNIDGVIMGGLAVTRGSHSITTAINFQTDTNVSLATGTSLQLDGPIQGSGLLQIGGGGLAGLGTGTLTLAGNTSGYSGNINVGTGTLLIAANPTGTGIGHRALASISVGSGALFKIAAPPSSADRQAIVVASLSLAGSTAGFTGLVDLTGNDLVVQNGNLAQLTAAVKQGFNAGSWQGSAGISSATAAANSTHLTALGVIQNSTDGTTGGSTLYPNFDGVSGGAATDVLIKYTYYGDANLDGAVTSADYTRIDAGFLSQGGSTLLTGWLNGDFNYDGTINGSDYTLIDNAFNTQGAAFAASIAGEIARPTAQISGSESTALVPEPSVLALAGLSAASLLTRRRPRARQSLRSVQNGFTLVELLVVIGIIALLISLLLPALTRARQVAQRTACAAKLQQIMVAANVHRADHKDYYPLAGVLTGGQPQELDDPDSQKYDYLNSTNDYNITSPNVTRVLAPITNSLGAEMGFARLLNVNSNAQSALSSDAQGLLRNFLCPAQASSVQDVLAIQPTIPALYIAHYQGTSYAYSFTYGSPQSYIFNEYVLGFNDTYARLRGHAAQVRQPATTLFAADGLGDTNVPARVELGIASNAGTYTLYNRYPVGTLTLPSPAISLADVFNARKYNFQPVAGTATCFDSKRHQNKINIAFCDGHVENRNITTGDLNSVFLMAP